MWTILTAVFASFIVGEAAIVVGFVVVAAGSWIWIKRRWLSVVLSVACVIALGLHGAGFKLYGRAVIVSGKEVLRQPKRVVALEPPSRVVLDDGSSFELPEVFFPKGIDLSKGATNYDGIFQDDFRVLTRLSRGRAKHPWLEVEMESPEATISKAVCLRAVTYGCGGTFFPHFLPRRLPREVRVDLGAALSSLQVAFPTAERLQNANPYWDPLYRAVSTSYFDDLPPQHPQLIRLGRSLLDRDFVLGTKLLVEVGDTNSYPTLIEAILAGRMNNENIENTGSTSPRIANRYLMRMDSSAAKEAFAHWQKQTNHNVFAGTEIALLLARHETLTGLDYFLVGNQGNDLTAEDQAKAVNRLALSLGYLRDIPYGSRPAGKALELFPEWYANNRHQLSWIKQPDGKSGFGLKGGMVGDDAYLKTMEPQRKLVKAQFGWQ